MKYTYLEHYPVYQLLFKKDWFKWGDPGYNNLVIGFCNICQSDIIYTNLDAYWIQVMEHGLDHYPMLKLFL